MNKQLQIIARQLLLGISLLGMSANWSFGQSPTIGLEAALEMAKAKYAGLERAKLFAAQQAELIDVGLAAQRTQLFFSGEEFNFAGQSGVQALNIQQNFYLPKANRAQQSYNAQNALLAERELDLTAQELTRQVQHAYYQLQYTRQQKVLAKEDVQLYEDFLGVTTAQLTSGETGKVPQLAARSRLAKVRLELEHANEQYEIAFTLFNKWLQSDTLYDVATDLSLDPATPDTSLQNNPHLQIMQARKELAEAKVETQQAQLLPQINSGLRLQSAFGNFPLLGYQLGVNVPLFRKTYNKRIDAAKVNVKVQEAAIAEKRQNLDRTISELNYRIVHQRSILDYINRELRPVLEEQQEASLQTYREGALGYLAYLDSLEQIMDMKRQYLNALYQLNALRVELTYWLGN